MRSNALVAILENAAENGQCCIKHLLARLKSMRQTSFLSQRLQHLSPSPTISLGAKVKELQQKGLPIIDLAVGEPNFTTPLHILKAAKAAIDKGFTHYTATPGISELREAIAQKINQQTGANYLAQQIVVGVGSKQLLYNTFQVLLNLGSEVLVATPTWSTYIDQIKLAQGKVVLIPLASPFKLCSKDVAAKITAKTKIILLNSPNNPTGAMIEKSELVKIAKLAVRKKIWLVSDEIYDQLTYGSGFMSVAAVGSKIRAQSVVINGFSKTYAMTGWRVGYAAAPLEIAQALSDLQTQTTSNTSSISQYAALAAITGSAKSIQKMKTAFQKRRQLVYQQFSTKTKLGVILPEGAFYFFVSLAAYLKPKQTSQQWCAQLLEEAQVAVVPGEAFLAPGYFRLSYAASETDLKQAVAKIIIFLRNHEKT